MGEDAPVQLPTGRGSWRLLVPLLVCLLRPSWCNLLVNPSAETGTMSGWTIHDSTPSDGWAVRSGGEDGCRRFITSYEWCVRSQEVDLVARGFSAAALDGAPVVDVAEWSTGSDPDPNDFAYLSVQLRDASHVAFATFETGVFRVGPGWQPVAHRFTDYGPGLRYVYWEDGGKDTELWLGQYGAQLDAASCELDLPLARPRLLVAPAFVDFGTQGTGDGPTPAQAVVITNTGQADLFYNACLVGRSAAEFLFTSLPAGRVLTAGQSAFIWLAFDPTLDGNVVGRLRVWSDDPDRPLVEVPLLGTAVFTPPPTFTYFELLDFATLWYTESPFAYDLVPDQRLDEKDLLEILSPR